VLGERGDNVALRRVVEAYQEALSDCYSRERMARRYAGPTLR